MEYYVIQPTSTTRQALTTSLKKFSKYPISHFLSYDAYSANHKAFVTNMYQHIEPSSFINAIQKPKWVVAMNAKLKALEKNQTWAIVPFPTHKQPIGYR